MLLFVFICHMNVMLMKTSSYLEKLGVLHYILDELDTTCVSILGDWNGDIVTPTPNLPVT